MTGRTRRRGRGDAERGVTAVEFAGWVPLLVLVALAALQLGLVGYAAQQAGSAARAAARVAAQDEISGAYQTAGRAAMSDWLSGTFSGGGSCGADGVVTVTAEVEIPSVLPFMSTVGRATKSVSMPCD